MTTKGIGSNIFPATPSTMSMGAKAAMVVRTPKITGTATSRAPTIAAVSVSG